MKAFSSVLTLAASLLAGAPLLADGPGYWPQWRGPSGQGYVTDTKVPLEWSATKNLLWKTNLPGAGHSTPIIWGNRLFLTCANGNGSKRWVVCVDTNSGKIEWQQLASEGLVEKKYQTNSHASPSCVTDGEHIYAFFGTPGLFCYTLDGKPVWRHEFGIFTSETGWGIGASPVLYQNLVIQNCDNDGAKFLPPGKTPKDAAPESLVALDKKTGDVVWQTPRNQGRGFSTPVLITDAGGREQLVLNGPRGVWAYEPKTGKELWHCDRHPEEDNQKFGEPLPLFTKSIMFTAAGRNTGFLQAIKLGGEGDVTSSGLEWEIRRKGIRDVGSGILAGDVLIYADKNATISAHDVKTGKQLYFERTRGSTKSFYASPVMIKGKVLCLRQDGTSFVIEPGPELKIVHQNVLSDGTDFSASPAVANGKLYLRSQTHLYCIGASK